MWFEDGIGDGSLIGRNWKKRRRGLSFVVMRKWRRGGVEKWNWRKKVWCLA